MSTLCPLPVLTDNLTGPLLTCQAIQLMPRILSPVLPRVPGLEHGGQQTAPLTAAPSGTPTLFPAPAGGKELCRSWLAQPLQQPGTVMDRLTTYGWRGQACAHVYSVWQPTCQRNKYICFGNAVGSLHAAQALKVLLVSGPYSFYVQESLGSPSCPEIYAPY